jgi:hypothetical protein
MINTTVINNFCDTYRKEFDGKTKWNRSDAVSKFYKAWTFYFESYGRAYFDHFKTAKVLFLSELQHKNSWGRDELRQLLEATLRSV